MTRPQATLIGTTAILLWASLAALTVLSQPVPAMLLNALTFGIGGVLGMGWLIVSGSLGKLRGISLSALAFGTAGLFGYHALYVSALRLAAPVEASLINYLWPLFIVLLSGLLPGERLKRGHILGALLGFAGAVLIVVTRAPSEAQPGAALGLLLAFLAAITWALYSLGSRRMAGVPTEAVALYCLGTAVLSALLHLGFEDTAWPADSTGWIAVAVLGAGPVGLAFYVWDIGVKRGDIQLLGVASYAAPLLTTFGLWLTGQVELTAMVGLAACLITLGAVIAARAGRKPRQGAVAAKEGRAA
ncbi:aromatic amino acid exporter YddG [Falsigemmobacter faecalis]|uniref:EamA family transporter n=1 Tax=Falsigemmobacter faecalis TaxID=2488730 RepID=A0A3P3DAW0_9RHOB|nr:EamA family transporter [Falsigemmobacter faecalis]RRH71485.1 EamA family transporter [Falsigemmobacter faecalis]